MTWPIIPDVDSLSVTAISPCSGLTDFIQPLHLIKQYSTVTTHLSSREQATYHLEAMSPSLDKRWQFGKRQSVFEPALPADAGGVAPTLPSESEPLQTQNPVSNASTRVVVAISVVFGVVFIGCALFVIYLCRLKIRAKEQGRYGRFGTGRGKGPTKFRGQPPRSEGRHGGLRGGYNDRPPDSSPYHNGGPSRSQGSLFRPPPIYCLPSTTGENYRPKPSPSSEQDTYLAPLEYCSRSPFRKSGALSDVISNNLSYPTNDSESSPYKPDYNTARRGSSYESIRGVDDWRGWRSDLDDLSPRSPESSIRGKSLGENSSRQYDSQGTAHSVCPHCCPCFSHSSCI